MDDRILDAVRQKRELRSSLEVGAEYRGARKTLIVDRPVPRGVEAPRGVDVVALWRWLLAPSVAWRRACAPDGAVSR